MSASSVCLRIHFIHSEWVLTDVVTLCVQEASYNQLLDCAKSERLETIMADSDQTAISELNELECPICLQRRQLQLLPCSHLFCNDCLSEWVLWSTAHLIFVSSLFCYMVILFSSVFHRSQVNFQVSNRIAIWSSIQPPRRVVKLAITDLQVHL